MKKCLIVYYSYHHGNTKKIAAAMAEALALGVSEEVSSEHN